MSTHVLRHTSTHSQAHWKQTNKEHVIKILKTKLKPTRPGKQTNRKDKDEIENKNSKNKQYKQSYLFKE